MRLTLIAAFGLLVAATPAFAGEDTPAEHNDWVADFDKAVEIAKKDNKLLLVDFTGSDWCGWCIKLHEEVFAHKQFLDAAKSKYVLVALDFPHGDEAKAKVPNPERNDELKNKYGIRGFPSILVLTTDGEVILQTGYRPGGPAKYVEYLAKGAEAHTLSTEIAAAWAAADESAKPAIMKRASEALAGFESPKAAARIKDIVMAAYAADPKNEKGLRLPALKALLASNNATPEMITEGNALDPKNEKGIRELCVKATFGKVSDKPSAETAVKTLDEMGDIGFKDTEMAFGLYFRGMRWCMMLGNKPMAVRFAEAAKKIGVDNKKQMEMIQKIIDENKPAP